MTDRQAKHTDRIVLDGMVLRGHHGVTAAERELVQRFRIDLTLELDLSKPSATDDLRDACDYTRVYECVRHIVEERSFHLLEAMASCIADSILAEQPMVSAVRVGAYKPDPPIRGSFERAGVEIWRERGNDRV